MAAIRANPVYVREKGGWGQPNPFYAYVMRYSPFVVIGAILFGVCAGSVNPALFNSGNEGFLAATCFICLPGFLLTAVTLYAQFMVPALTAPTISLERAQGTWDILRLTPLSVEAILLGKLLGGLSRLRVWPVLFVLSALQGGILACTVSLFGGEQALWGWLMGLATMIRPWAEILFAALIGFLMSASAPSTTLALVGAYAIIVLLKLFNSSGVWLAALLLAEAAPSATLVIPTVGPVMVYVGLVTAVTIGLFRQLKKLSYE